MEEQLHPLAATHLLQHTLRSLCIHEGSQWVYAVFWRILPRNYPPPKWDLPGSIYDRSRGNRRNWILVWEDGFCNFAASCGEQSAAGCEEEQQHQQQQQQTLRGLQPDLFFKMSHEIYNYGEGLIGKVAADHGHKWVFKEPQEQEVNFLSSWHNPADSYPRTWEAQFQSGIKTIALIAVREGVLQLGAVNKVTEDLNYVLILRKKFSYLESIPGVFLPHPSAAAFPGYGVPPPLDGWPFPHPHPHHPAAVAPIDMYNQLRITPSMSSLEALLSKLPSVAPPPPGPSSGYCEEAAMMVSPSAEKVEAKDEVVVVGGDYGVNGSEGSVELSGGVSRHASYFNGNGNGGSGEGF